MKILKNKNPHFINKYKFLCATLIFFLLEYNLYHYKKYK